MLDPPVALNQFSFDSMTGPLISTWFLQGLPQSFVIIYPNGLYSAVKSRLTLFRFCNESGVTTEPCFTWLKSLNVKRTLKKLQHWHPAFSAPSACLKGSGVGCGVRSNSNSVGIHSFASVARNIWNTIPHIFLGLPSIGVKRNQQSKSPGILNPRCTNA